MTEVLAHYAAVETWLLQKLRSQGRGAMSEAEARHYVPRLKQHYPVPADGCLHIVLDRKRQGTLA